MKLKVALPFSDDSTLFFALQVRRLLQDLRQPPEVETVLYTKENALSQRQLDTLLPEGPDLRVGRGLLSETLQARTWDAVVTSRMYRPLNAFLQDPENRDQSDRTRVISFLGGLDFFPEQGFVNRRHSDAIFLFPRSRIAQFHSVAQNWESSPAEVSFGHPAAVQTGIGAADISTRKDIYFFAQALSPLSRRGRMHMLRVLRAIALANPDRTIWIKLRHLPDENRKHKHQEKYDYASLIDKMPGHRPDNLRLTACTMQDALENAAIGITCTSTAAVDLVRAGLPAMVYLDYVDCYVDPLVEPMRDLFGKSGLIRSLEDILALKVAAPSPEWRDDMFCPDDLGSRIVRAVAHLNKSKDIR